MVLDCVNGLSVQSKLQVAPKNSGLSSITIISVGGSIVNLVSGRQIDFPRKDGVYKLNASMRIPAVPDYELEVMPVTIDEQEERLVEAGEPRAVRQQLQPTIGEIATHELTRLPYRSWCCHCVRGTTPP